MSKLSIYCGTCGSPNYYISAKPKFCQSCGKPFAHAKGSIKALPTREVVCPVEEEDEEHFESNLNELDIDVQTWENQGTSLGVIMAANPDTKLPERSGQKAKKSKRGDKKRFLSEWEKEAGSIRKQNE